MWFLSFVFLLGLHFSTVSPDCGCNKLNRDSPSYSEVTQNPATTTCSIDSNLISTSQSSDDVLIPGGQYTIGAKQPIFKEDREDERLVTIESFYLDKYEVSNAKFQEFVKATGYETEAEKFGDSFVFGGFIDEATKEKFKDFRVAAAPWWYKLNGTNWQRPEGPDSSITERMDHPVVHVSWNDAVSYCKWVDKRLPTEAEWEVACRGGRKGKLFPWGDKLTPRDEHWMNIWQGQFPEDNTGADGYESTNPVDKFPQNTFELYNIIGNVWEWTADMWDKYLTDSSNPERVKKGGSYLYIVTKHIATVIVVQLEHKIRQIHRQEIWDFGVPGIQFEQHDMYENDC